MFMPYDISCLMISHELFSLSPGVFIYAMVFNLHKTGKLGQEMRL